jgi:hypothetical protein
MLAKSDVDRDDVSAELTSDEHTTFHGSERDREIGFNGELSVAVRRIQTTRDVERDDVGAAIAQRANAADAIGGGATGCTRRTCAKHAVDDNLFSAGRAIEAEACERGSALGLRVIGLCIPDLFDSHLDADRRERSRNDPRIAAVVADAREHGDAAREAVAEPADDLAGRCCSGALHQRT